jgi:hypothetical protein
LLNWCSFDEGKLRLEPEVSCPGPDLAQPPPVHSLLPR